MKLKFDPLIAIAGAALLGVVILAGLFVGRALEPARLEWQSVAIQNVTSVSAEFVANTRRRPIEGCTNGIQADLRTPDGVIARLPVPLRAQTPDMSSYALVLPDLQAGRYETKVRESFICKNTFETIESPWVAFEVKR